MLLSAVVLAVLGLLVSALGSAAAQDGGSAPETEDAAGSEPASSPGAGTPDAASTDGAPADAAEPEPDETEAASPSLAEDPPPELAFVVAAPDAPAPVLTIVGREVPSLGFVMRDMSVRVDLAVAARFARPAPSDETLRVGVILDSFEGFDPMLAESVSELIVADLLRAGLTTHDNGVIGLRGDAAATWQFVDDTATWRVTLDEVTGTGGFVLEASDVRATIERAARLAPDAFADTPIASLVGWEVFAAEDTFSILGITLIDDATLEFALDQPEPGFPDALADPRLGLVHPLDPQLSTGDWTVVEQHLDHLVLESASGAQFARVMLIAYPDRDTLGEAYAIGAVDVAAIASGVDDHLSWKVDLDGVASHPDGTFDPHGVTRN